MRKASRRRFRKASHGRSGVPPGRSRAAAAVAASPAGGARRSATMAPSLISMMRWARLATAMSWVTMITVRPSACSSPRMRSTSSPLCRSRAPVGSSASTTSAPFISARAIDTRCCCPPDSWPGRWPMRSAMPSRPSRAAARVWRSSARLPA
jgi:hypothetical protein